MGLFDFLSGIFGFSDHSSQIQQQIQQQQMHDMQMRHIEGHHRIVDEAVAEHHRFMEESDEYMRHVVNNPHLLR